MRSIFFQILSLVFVLMLSSPSLAATLGPAETIGDLRAMIDEANTNDTLLIAGEIVMDDGLPLMTRFPVRMTSESEEIGVLRITVTHEIPG